MVQPAIVVVIGYYPMGTNILLMVPPKVDYMASYRFKGASETVWEAYPDSLIDIANIITELGGADGIILLLALLFWLVDREKILLLAAVTVAGVAFYLSLKSALAMPRPITDPAMNVEAVVELGDDEYGFPSGHAFNAVIVYGGLLYYFDKYRDPRWVAAIATLIVTIAMTRIFLRLHYLGDLVVGAAIGVVFLLAMDRLMDGDARIGFGLGILFGIVAVLISGDTGSVLETEAYALTVLGVAIGGFLAAFKVDSIPDLASREEGAILAATGLAYIVALLAAYSMYVGEPGTALSNIAIVVVHMAVIVGVLLLPFVSHEIENRRNPAAVSG